LSGKAILVEAIPVSQNVEALAQQLIAKNSTAFLSEIVWSCAIAIPAIKGDFLDASRAKGARIPFSSPVSAAATAEAI